MAAGDVILTSALVFFLNSAKQDQDDTNSVLDRIISNTVRNNGATALTATVSAALFVWGVGAWHVIAGLIISKLYQVAFMSSLNARVGLAEELRMRRTTGMPATPVPGGLPAIRLSGMNGSPGGEMGSRSRSRGRRKSRSQASEASQRHTVSSGHLGLPSFGGMSFGHLATLSRPSFERRRSDG